MKRYIIDYREPLRLPADEHQAFDLEDYLNTGPYPGYVVAALDGRRIIWRLDLQAYCALSGRVDVTGNEVTIYEQDQSTVAKRFRFKYRDGIHISATEEL